ncbi:MAG: S8 family serine peptidase, partial [Pseudobdellovibrionaceae bacterium]
AKFVNLVQSAMTQLGARVLSIDNRTLVVSLKNSNLVRLSNVEGVEFIEPTVTIESFFADIDFPEMAATGTGDYSDLVGYESGTKLMNFNETWTRGFNGSGQVAAIADTGFDNGDANSIHGDLRGAVKKGVPYGLFSESWEDPNGHGTHVAGSVLGRGTESIGQIRGGAYGAQLVAQSLWSPMLDNLSIPTPLTKIFIESLRDGARVHSNSWGTPAGLGEYQTISQQVDEFMWNNPDMLIIFAAGNSGEDLNADGKIDPNSICAPGTAKNVLTVGASENLISNGGIQKQVKELKDASEKWPADPISSSKISDNASGVAMFSSRGPTKDGRLKPEIVAPGTNILSLRSHHPKAGPLWGAYNDQYAWAGGTSMATPLTAGAAAVVREYLIRQKNIANPSAALVKAHLMATAFDLFPGQYGSGVAQEIAKARPEMNEGFGRVDMAKATAVASSAIVIDEREGVAQGSEKTYSISVSGNKLTVVVVWTDAPGAASAAKSLVNDLNLAVESGNAKLQDNAEVNNHAFIESKNIQPGNYTIRVSGNKVPQGKLGKQPFAIVAVTE